VNKENASKLWKIIQEAGDYLLVQRDKWQNNLAKLLTSRFN